MNFKSTAPQSARNAGLVAVGFCIALIMWQWVDCYAVVLSTLAGAITYMSDRFMRNAPSLSDPFLSLFGGLLFVAIQYVRRQL